jgi:anti-anti-sigma factor
MSELLNISFVERPGATTVCLQGEIDLSVCGDVSDALTTAIGRASHAVRLDMDAIIYIDSAGLQCLIVATGLAEGKGVEFSIGRASAVVTRIVELCGLDERFPTNKSTSVALETRALRSDDLHHRDHAIG